MLELYDGDYVEQDLQELPDADLIEAFLTQVAESDEALWTLTKWPGEHHTPFFNVKGIEVLHQRGFNIYRLRPLNRKLREYRILYAYDAQHDDFYILAVVMKLPEQLPPGASKEDFYNYELDHPITKRICDEYEAFGLPKIA